VAGTGEMLSKGIPLEGIMLRGGWRSEITEMRYLKKMARGILIIG